MFPCLTSDIASARRLSCLARREALWRYDQRHSQKEKLPHKLAHLHVCKLRLALSNRRPGEIGRRN
jgi:hypothetical protein